MAQVLVEQAYYFFQTDAGRKAQAACRAVAIRSQLDRMAFGHSAILRQPVISGCWVVALVPPIIEVEGAVKRAS